ncbi:MAG: hypothetical protein JXA10_18395, partial [Anaerolineae bacterium]|nr:hypothetical protein [Anaerolineae bacterium]
MMMQGDGSAFASLICIIILVSVVIDKTFGFGYMLDPGPYTPEVCHEQIFFGTYLIRVAMFVGPLSIAGMTQNPKSRGVAIVAGISGGVYMFARWYYDQRDSPYEDIVCSSYIGFFMLAARVYLGSRFRLGTIYRHIPVTVTGQHSAHKLEV